MWVKSVVWAELLWFHAVRSFVSKWSCLRFCTLQVCFCSHSVKNSSFVTDCRNERVLHFVFVWSFVPLEVIIMHAVGQSVKSRPWFLFTLDNICSVQSIVTPQWWTGYEGGVYRWASTFITAGIPLVPEPRCSPWPSWNHLSRHACAVLPLYRRWEGKQPHLALLLRERGTAGHCHRHHQDRCPADPWHWDRHEGSALFFFLSGFPLLHFLFCSQPKLSLHTEED